MSEWRFAAAAVVLAGLLEAILPGSALAQQGAPPPAVLVQAAEAKPIAAQREFIGRAAAVDKVDLHARVKGFLGPRLFTDGDEVKEGQVVFTIEPETFQAAVAQKAAQRDAAKAALANSEIQLRRAAELLRTNTGTQAVYDQRISEQLQAKAAVEDAEAQLRDAQIQLSYTEIKSPIPGRIGRASASPGNLVSPVTGVLATVVNDQPMRVLFSVTHPELLVGNDKNVVEQRRVKTGISRDGMLVIDEGLKAGEKVVIQGQQRVRPGMTVTPTTAPALKG